MIRIRQGENADKNEFLKITEKEKNPFLSASFLQEICVIRVLFFLGNLSQEIN
jgi:hypothetical protein